MSERVQLPFSVLPDLYDALRGNSRIPLTDSIDPTLTLETAEGAYQIPLSSADQLLNDLTQLDRLDGQADGKISQDVMTNALLSSPSSEDYLSVFVESYPQTPVTQLEQRFRTLAVFDGALQRKPVAGEISAAADAAFCSGWRSEQIEQWIDSAARLYAGQIIFDIFPAEERRGVGASNSVVHSPTGCATYGVSGPQFLNIPVNPITGRLSAREIATTLRHEVHHAEFTRSSPGIINNGTADAPCYTIPLDERASGVLRLFIDHHRIPLQAMLDQRVPLQRMFQHPGVQRWLEESMAEGAVVRAGLTNASQFSKQVSAFLRDELKQQPPQRLDLAYAAYLVAIGDALGMRGLADQTLLTTKIETTLASTPSLLQSWKDLVAIMQLGTTTITEP